MIKNGFVTIRTFFWYIKVYSSLIWLYFRSSMILYYSFASFPISISYWCNFTSLPVYFRVLPVSFNNIFGFISGLDFDYSSVGRLKEFFKINRCFFESQVSSLMNICNSENKGVNHWYIIYVRKWDCLMLNPYVWNWGPSVLHYS